MRIPFLGQAYQARSPISASQTLVNLYLERLPKGESGSGESGGSFIGTPGLTKVFQGSGEVRGLRAAPDGCLYATIGSTVWRIDSAYHGVSLGTLPNSTGRVSMINNDSQVAVAHQTGWHWVAFSGSAIQPVAGSPPGSILSTQDEYVLFTESNAGAFGITALGDLSSIDPLDFASAEGAPDNLVSVICDHREVVLLGTESIEIWTDTGAAFFPFERAPGGYIEQGCAAKWSPTKLDNSVFWLGADRNGWAMVFRSNVYIPQRISTHAIEYDINQYPTVQDCIGYSYQEEGHDFCVFIFPSGDATWVYDVATDGWHKRVWLDPVTGGKHRHRANCYEFFNGEHIVGDWQNGKIYRTSLEVYTDDGDPIQRERAFEVPDAENHRIRMDKLELIATTGDGDPTSTTPPKVWLQVSRDAGRHFGYQRFVGLGKIGQRRARARWRRLGFGRDVVLRVATTMNNRVCWTGANLTAEALDQ